MQKAEWWIKLKQTEFFVQTMCVTDLQSEVQFVLQNMYSNDVLQSIWACTLQWQDKRCSTKLWAPCFSLYCLKTLQLVECRHGRNENWPMDGPSRSVWRDVPFCTAVTCACRWGGTGPGRNWLNPRRPASRCSVTKPRCPSGKTGLVTGAYCARQRRGWRWTGTGCGSTWPGTMSSTLPAARGWPMLPMLLRLRLI